MFLISKMEEGATSQTMQEASTSWQRQEMRFSPRASGRTQPCQHNDLNPVRSILEFLPSGAVRYYIHVVLGHDICDSLVQQ